MRNQGIFKSTIHSLRWTAPIFDVLLWPLTFLAAVWFRVVRSWGVSRLPLTKRSFLGIGMFPIVDHYYDPLFDYRKVPARAPRTTSIALNAETQLRLVSTFNYAVELLAFPMEGIEDAVPYYYRNGSYEAGDAELYYSMIRKFRPKQIVEIGSGFSTRVAMEAVRKNENEDPTYSCKVTCIEPYEMPWLTKLNVTLIRKKVESMDPEVFQQLEEGDILFIDSSHMVRPGGDVTFLILDILPRLRKGVLIHFHDIFTPADYPMSWLKDHFRFWNEQYLLEAFLAGNSNFEVICALNYLAHHHEKQIEHAFPIMARAESKEPGAIWLRKVT